MDFYDSDGIASDGSSSVCWKSQVGFLVIMSIHKNKACWRCDMQMQRNMTAMLIPKNPKTSSVLTKRTVSLESTTNYRISKHPTNAISW